MAEHRQLSHPPLKEAVIDLRLRVELPQRAVEEMSNTRLHGFGTPTQIWRSKRTIQVGIPQPGQALPAENSDEQFGWRFLSESGSRGVQFKRDGITLSILSGYTTWANARDSAADLWGSYCSVARPSEVARIAVRYVNVLGFAAGQDIDLYLTAGPRIPPGLPQTLNGFLQRVVIPLPGEGTVATITQAMQAGKDANSVSVVLDIDVWRDAIFRPDSPELWPAFDILREMKNRIFFGSVTDKVLEPYI